MLKKMQSGSLRTIVRLALIVWGVIVTFPVVWVLYSSLKDNRAFYQEPWALPDVLHFENYYNAWVTSEFGSYFLNSALVVAAAVLLSLLMAATTAYVFAKYKMRGLRTVENIYVTLMMIPQVLILIPLFFRLNAVHLIDRLWVLILLYAVQAVPFAVFLLVGFIRRIHGSFLEAAAIDGCSEFQVFFKIVLPMIKPGLFIAAIVNFMSIWNEYILAITLIKSESKFTIPVGLRNLTVSMQYGVDFGALFAGLVIAMVPVLILYGIFQKQLQEGMASISGVKE